jgi:Zn-dependent protease with chaperone function
LLSIKLNSRLYDGLSPIAKVGVSSLYSDTILFESEDTEIRFDFSKFYKLEQNGIIIQLVLMPDEGMESPILEMIFEDKNQIVDFKKKFYHHRKDQGLIHQFYHWLHSVSKVKIISTAIGLFTLAIGVIYFVAIYSYKFVPTTVDTMLGDTSKDMVESQFTICKDSKSESILNESIKTLIPKNSPFKYEVKLISNEQPNAFAVSGGKIYVLSGLFEYAKNSEEVGGVLAHEIAHVERRHHIRNLLKGLSTAFVISVFIGPGIGDLEVLETLTELGSTLMVLSYSRQFEEEADEYGIQFMSQSGYHPKGMASFFKSMLNYERGTIDSTNPSNKPSLVKDKKEGKDSDSEKESFSASNVLKYLSTHPPTEDRIDRISKIITKQKLNGSRKFISDKDWNYLRNSCKLP